MGQADVVGLLTVGSAAQPAEGKLAVGEEGMKQLVAVREEGEKKGLAAFFEREGEGAMEKVRGLDGMPPLPPGQHMPDRPSAKRYLLEEEQSYGDG